MEEKNETETSGKTQTWKNVIIWNEMQSFELLILFCWERGSLLSSSNFCQSNIKQILSCLCDNLILLCSCGSDLKWWLVLLINSSWQLSISSWEAKVSFFAEGMFNWGKDGKNHLILHLAKNDDDDDVSLLPLVDSHTFCWCCRGSALRWPS